jgi:nicotinate phosphoribosyltransferase
MVSAGGPKNALRRRSALGVAEAEVVGVGTTPQDDGDDRALLVPLVHDGEVVGRESLDAIRARHLAVRAELPVAVQQMSRGEPVIPTIHV